LADTFTVTVTDGYGDTTAVPVTVAIAPQNSPPVAAPAKVTAVKPSTGVVSGGVSAVDPDGDSLTYSAPTSIPKGAVSVNSSTGAFTYTPTATARRNAAASPAGSAAKTASFTVTVSDGYGGTTTVPVKVKVAAR
jgi:VCBS repeat-containing protein